MLDAAAIRFGGFFFAATDATQADALASLGRALAGHTGGGRYTFADWDEALERLFGAVSDGLIIIDEFPYLMKASPELPSLIQRALGPRGYARQSRARLVLSGSAMSVMGHLLGGNAPLRGRASMDMIIRPFGYRDAARFWDISDPRLALLVHSIAGGTPAYRSEFVTGDSPASLADFDPWVLRTVLNPQLPLFREARYLLAEEADGPGWTAATQRERGATPRPRSWLRWSGRISRPFAATGHCRRLGTMSSRKHRVRWPRASSPIRFGAVRSRSTWLFSHPTTLGGPVGSCRSARSRGTRS